MAAAAPQPTSRRKSLRRTPEHAAEAGRDRRADLGVAGLQPDGGADAVRDDRLQPRRSGCHSATCARHTARWPRSGRPPGAGASARSPGRAGRAAARPASGTSDGADRVELDHRAEALAGADLEQHLVDQLRRRGHRQTAMPAPQPTKAASTTSQISSVRTSARSVCGACSTASPKARRGDGSGRGRSSPRGRGRRGARDG